MNRIADLRIASLAEASAIFDDLARHTIDLAAIDAQAEKKIAAIKAAHAADTDSRRARIEELATSLRQFIEANKGLFANPRKVKTDFGSYGLQKASGLVVDDEQKAIASARRQGLLDCFADFSKLVKDAVKQHLTAGKKLAGVTLATGDTAVYSVDRALIKRAAEDAQ